MRLINKCIGFIFAVMTASSANAVSDTLFPSVFVKPLPAVSINTVGIETGIPVDIWGVSSRSDMERLIKELSGYSLSPAMQNVLADLMITKTHPASLSLEFRLNVLMRLGRWNDIIRLVELVPPQHRTADIKAMVVYALFLSGRTKEACDMLRTGKDLNQMAEEMQLSCALSKQDIVGASLIFSTQKEGGQGDKMTVALAERVFDGKQSALPSEKILPKHLMLLSALGNKINWEELNLSFPLKKALASMGGVPWAYRVKAAEQTVSADVLVDIYLAVPKDSQTTNASVRRALLYQKINAEKNKEQQIRFILDYLQSARNDAVFLQGVPVIEPFLNHISAEQKNISIAFHAVQIYALSGQADRAYAWMQILQNSPDPVYQKQAVLLAPLMQWLGGGISAQAIKYCQKTPDEGCAKLFRQANLEGFETDVDRTLYPWKNQSMYAITAAQTIRYLDDNNRKGEALMRGMKALYDSPYFETDIVKGLAKITPKKLINSFIAERYVIDENGQ